MTAKKTRPNVNIIQFGILVYALERFFRMLQFFPPQCFIGNRVDAFRKSNFPGLTPEKQKQIAIQRGKRIDRYIIGCVAVEIACVALVATGEHENPFLKYAIPAMAVLRLIDIIQVNVNMVVFDALRTGASSNFMASGERSLVNATTNFFEMIICFGLVYNCRLSLLSGAHNWGDGFYFSIVTQSTLGYGDMAPLLQFKWIAGMQVLIGYLFSALIISRFISILPTGQRVIKDSDN